MLYILALKVWDCQEDQKASIYPSEIHQKAMCPAEESWLVWLHLKRRMHCHHHLARDLRRLPRLASRRAEPPVAGLISDVDGRGLILCQWHSFKC